MILLGRSLMRVALVVVVALVVTGALAMFRVLDPSSLPGALPPWGPVSLGAFVTEGIILALVFLVPGWILTVIYSGFGLRLLPPERRAQLERDARAQGIDLDEVEKRLPGG